MTQELQSIEDASKDRILNRAKRLVRLLELNAPKMIIAKESVLVLRACFTYAPIEIADDLKDLFFKSLKIGMGRCSNDECENHITGDQVEPLCPTCEAKRVKEREENPLEPPSEEEMKQIEEGEKEDGP